MLYSSMPKSPATLPIARLFRALADPTRLRLLNLIGNREICVCYFVQILGLSQPKISRHLAYLRRAGIVTARRDGKWMHYRLAMPRDETAAAILQETVKNLARQAGDAARYCAAWLRVLPAGEIRTASRRAPTASRRQHSEVLLTAALNKRSFHS